MPDQERPIYHCTPGAGLREIIAAGFIGLTQDLPFRGSGLDAAWFTARADGWEHGATGFRCVRALTTNGTPAATRVLTVAEMNYFLGGLFRVVVCRTDAFVPMIEFLRRVDLLCREIHASRIDVGGLSADDWHVVAMLAERDERGREAFLDRYPHRRLWHVSFEPVPVSTWLRVDVLDVRSNQWRDVRALVDVAIPDGPEGFRWMARAIPPSRPVPVSMADRIAASIFG